MRSFTRDDGERIRRKLGGSVREGQKRSGHDHVVISHNGLFVGSYGLRRGSDVSHNYIPKQIGLSPREARELVSCTLSAAQYFALQRERGRI